jgi:YidC/Oxa1 family membrane protein insertase
MQAQTRNWVLFFLSFILIFVGYTWLRNRVWPPPKPLSPEARADVDVASRVLANSMPGGNLGDAVRLAAAVNFNRDDEHRLALALLQDREEKKKQAAAKPPEPVKRAEPAKPAETIPFGGEGYYLAGEFINRGAGVDKLTLVPFNAADWFGRPARNDQKKPLPLQLIHHAETPAFAVYHYADEKDERPLDTLGTRDWEVVEKHLNGDEQRVAFATALPEFGVRIVKTFTLRPREYHLGLDVRVERLADAKESKKFSYQLAGVGTPYAVDPRLSEGERLIEANKRSMPIEGGWYTTVNRNALFDWVDANGADKRNLFDSRSIAHSSGSDRVPENPPFHLQYAAVATQFFTSAIVVGEDQPRQDFIKAVRATLEGEVDPAKPQLADITVRAIAEPLEPKAGAPVEHKYVLYHGPVKVALLEKLSGEGSISAELADRYANKLHLNTFTDYGTFSGGYFRYWTDAIIACTNAVHWLIGVFRYIIPNFPGRDAICIILVTVLVRLIMMPLSRRQQGSMARTQEAMAKLKPEIAKLNEKYKNDLLAKQQAQMELYRKHGVNPAAGLGGCLLLLVQMPIFLGLYFALQESFFFRLEPFLWIRNLTAPDMLFWWSEKIPFISEPASLGSFFYLGPYFNLLPILALTLMFLQMKWMQPPAADEQMAQQQKMTQYIMIPMFAFLFYKMPAGLCLYFTATTLWGMAERKWLIKKKPLSPPAAAGGDNGRAGPRGRGKGRVASAPPGKLRAWWEKLLKEASKK